jgi:hypothetical protein
MIFKKYFCLIFILIALVGCTNQKITSPMLFSGEGESWKVEMVIEQEKTKGTNEYRARYIYNITYKHHDIGKYAERWLDGEEVLLDFYIEGLYENEDERHQQSIFYGSLSHWISGILSNSFSEPYTKENELKVIIKLDDKEEKFTLKFNDERTKELENIEGDVTEDLLREPIGERKYLIN